MKHARCELRSARVVRKGRVVDHPTIEPSRCRKSTPAEPHTNARTPSSLMDVELAKDDLREIEDANSRIQIRGERYSAANQAMIDR